MKIYQLFIKKVEDELLAKLLRCFGLQGLEDRRVFNKHDMVQMRTVEQMKNLSDELATYYLPCKAKIYLQDLTEKRAITVLKQVIRLYDYHLASIEKNASGRKIINYCLVSNTSDTLRPRRMKHHDKASTVVTFS